MDLNVGLNPNGSRPCAGLLQVISLRLCANLVPNRSRVQCDTVHCPILGRIPPISSPPTHIPRTRYHFLTVDLPTPLLRL